MIIHSILGQADHQAQKPVPALHTWEPEGAEVSHGRTREDRRDEGSCSTSPVKKLIQQSQLKVIIYATYVGKSGRIT